MNKKIREMYAGYCMAFDELCEESNCKGKSFIDNQCQCPVPYDFHIWVKINKLEY